MYAEKFTYLAEKVGYGTETSRVVNTDGIRKGDVNKHNHTKDRVLVTTASRPPEIFDHNFTVFIDAREAGLAHHTALDVFEAEPRRKLLHTFVLLALCGTVDDITNDINDNKNYDVVLEEDGVIRVLRPSMSEGGSIELIEIDEEDVRG